MSFYSASYYSQISLKCVFGEKRFVKLDGPLMWSLIKAKRVKGSINQSHLKSFKI